MLHEAPLAEGLETDLTVVSMANVYSGSEVEDVVNEHACFMTSTSLKRGNDSGYGTNSLLEQWRATKRDDDYDPYDDYLYESHDTLDNVQAICDELDITVRVVAFFFDSIEGRSIECEAELLLYHDLLNPKTSSVDHF
ncbi:hypothetical protein Tco_1140480 [Tanacetum coccineum]